MPELGLPSIQEKGEKNNAELILDVIQSRKEIAPRHLVTEFVGSRKMSRPTVYRALRRLVEDDKIVIDGKGKYATYRIKGWMPEKGPPSQLDDFMILELKRLLSDILTSGLLVFNPEEQLYWIGIEDEKNALFVELNDLMSGTIGKSKRRPLNQKVIEEIRGKMEERKLLLRRCLSFYEPLEDLSRKRDIRLPWHWNKLAPFTPEFNEQWLREGDWICDPLAIMGIRPTDFHSPTLGDFLHSFTDILDVLTSSSRSRRTPGKGQLTATDLETKVGLIGN
jgi:hypothetical protein